LGAYAEGEHEITVDHIRHAAKEVRGHSMGPAPSRSGRSPDRSQYLIVAASILVAIIGTAWLFERWSPDSSASASHSSVEPLKGEVERVEEQEQEREQVAGLPETLPEEPSGPDELAVPDQLLDSVSAFQVLFGIWGRNYQPTEAPVACDWARENGLGCLNRQGSRRSLEFLDRPAMLQLQDEAGNTGFVVLRHLNGDSAEVAMPSGNQTVSFASIERHWFGEYRVLWRLPEYLTGDGFYSNGGGEQLWIGARMMDLADRHSESRAESDRVKRMNAEEQVRWYQALRGLTVDGIAGAMTIIQINNDLEASIPRLKPLQSDGRE
jgi:general secretion pathway protein A